MPVDSDDLATLTAIFPAHCSETLERYLAASSNSLERATAALLSSRPLGPLVKRRRVDGGLDKWLRVAEPEALAPSPPAKKEGQRSAFDLLRPPTSAPPPAPAPLPPLVLSTPALVSKHTGGLCTLVENVLPKELAARLFLRMIRESAGVGGPGWEKNRWILFDREVESPHTTSFYVEAPGEASAYDQAAFTQAAQYWYNGEERPARTFNSEMDLARQVIGPLVQTALAGRSPHPLEYAGAWLPNVAAANCYTGSKESVGWHSDVLTYLGPFPTIASLSLGVSRPFRLRSSSGLAPRTLSIPLPHNALLIMHAGTQERFRHCVPPVGAVDLWRVPRGLGIDEERGFKERINITFRFYRPDFAPLPTTPTSPSIAALVPPPNYVGTPLCACKIPCVLRPDAKGKARANLGKRSAESAKRPAESAEEEELLFFWQCNGGAQEMGRQCGHFKLLDMKGEGRGKWWGG